MRPPAVLPLLITAGLTLAAVAWIVIHGITWAGAMSYPLDDAYIHLAIVRQIVEHGVWGVNAGVSTSASSSPLWTVMLTAGAAAGLPLHLLPLALNVGAAVALLAGAHEAALDVDMPPWARLLLLMAVAALAPLPTITVVGMEHTLHAALCVWFLVAVRRWEQPWWRRGAIVLATVAPLVRFEAVAMMAITSVVMWPTSRAFAWRLTAAALATVAVFATVSTALGWLVLPNSVLVKLMLSGDDAPWMIRIWEGWATQGELFGLAGALAVLRVVVPTPSRIGREAMIVVGTALVHVAMGLRAPLYRYDVYLAAMLVTTLGCVAWRSAQVFRPVSWSFRHLAFLGAVILVAQHADALHIRGRHSVVTTAIAMRNIADQQRESARFVREFLSVPGPIALNDLGWMAFASGRDVVDVVGLGHAELAVMRLSGASNRQVIDHFSRAEGVRVAILFERWWGLDLEPIPGWVPIGSWQIDDNRVCGENAVVVYATDAASAEAVRRDLSAFSRTLPARTTVTMF